MNNHRFFLNNKFNYFKADSSNEISRKEQRQTIQIILLSINCFIGYMPNKLANNIMLYFLDTNTYNIYIAYSNMLIWLSHGIKLFIHLSFDAQYFIVFCRLFHAKQRLGEVNTTQYSTN
jgi:hypothetical protein